jgi:hypothetical protein
MNESKGPRRPSEGDRLGGTLSEGKLSTSNMHSANMRSAGMNTTLPPYMIGHTSRPQPVRDERKEDLHEDVMRGMEALHLDHRVWLNSLRFYREELFIFQKHLEQYVTTGAVPETMPHVEQYQNRFLRQSEVIAQLAHDIKKHDRTLGVRADDGLRAAIYRPFGVHNELRDRFETFERLYNELKHEFRAWLAHNR